MAFTDLMPEAGLAPATPLEEPTLPPTGVASVVPDLGLTSGVGAAAFSDFRRQTQSTAPTDPSAPPAALPAVWSSTTDADVGLSHSATVSSPPREDPPEYDGARLLTNRALQAESFEELAATFVVAPSDELKARANTAGFVSALGERLVREVPSHGASLSRLGAQAQVMAAQWEVSKLFNAADQGLFDDDLDWVKRGLDKLVSGTGTAEDRDRLLDFAVDFSRETEWVNDPELRIHPQVRVSTVGTANGGLRWQLSADVVEYSGPWPALPPEERTRRLSTLQAGALIDRGADNMMTVLRRAQDDGVGFDAVPVAADGRAPLVISPTDVSVFLGVDIGDAEPGPSIRSSVADAYRAAAERWAAESGQPLPPQALQAVARSVWSTEPATLDEENLALLEGRGPTPTALMRTAMNAMPGLVDVDAIHGRRRASGVTLEVDPGGSVAMFAPDPQGDQANLRDVFRTMHPSTSLPGSDAQRIWMPNSPTPVESVEDLATELQASPTPTKWEVFDAATPPSNLPSQMEGLHIVVNAHANLENVPAQSRHDQLVQRLKRMGIRATSEQLSPHSGSHTTDATGTLVRVDEPRVGLRLTFDSPADLKEAWEVLSTAGPSIYGEAPDRYAVSSGAGAAPSGTARMWEHTFTDGQKRTLRTFSRRADPSRANVTPVWVDEPTAARYGADIPRLAGTASNSLSPSEGSDGILGGAVRLVPGESTVKLSSRGLPKARTQAALAFTTPDGPPSMAFGPSAADRLAETGAASASVASLRFGVDYVDVELPVIPQQVGTATREAVDLRLFDRVKAVLDHLGEARTIRPKPKGN